MEGVLRLAFAAPFRAAEVARGHVEKPEQFQELLRCERALTIFDLAEPALGKVQLLSEGLLSPAVLLSQATDASGDLLSQGLKVALSGCCRHIDIPISESIIRFNSFCGPVTTVVTSA